MNYPEELRERYNEVMYDERDIIQGFLEKQYDIRYGRQRDTWHFEPAIEMIARQGSHVLLHDIKLDEGRFVVFYVEAFCDKNAEWECLDFAYGELSKVIEALPDADDVVKKNALADLNEMQSNLRIDLILSESPFIYNTDKKMFWSEFAKGNKFDFDKLGETYGTDFLSKLRDHINIEVLHRYNEYNKLVKFLSEQPNLCFEPANWGDVMFTIHGTDVKVDVLSASLDSNGKLQLCVDDDNKEAIYIEEKDIRPEYLVDLVGYIEDHCRFDIMDTYNAHDKELVRKINSAWKSGKYNQEFGYIIYSIANRDYNECKEKFDCDMDNFLSSIIDDCNKDSIHNVLENVCDDQDLETILSFIRYEE